MVPSSLQKPFRKAGLFEGRQVAVDAAVPTRHPARTVLAELGSIAWLRPSTNVCSMEFLHVSENASSMAAWEAALGTTMVGIAEQDDGHGELYMTQGGVVVFCSIVDPACGFVGRPLPRLWKSLDAVSEFDRCCFLINGGVTL